MAKRRRYNNSKCPEPINTLIDLAGALTLGLYTKHKIKKDFEKGEGEESAKAAGMVFGLGSMRRGSRGIINLGGLWGLNSALKDIERRQQSTSYTYPDPPYVDKVLTASPSPAPKMKKYLWRDHCEDGSSYGIYPSDYETADEYYDALGHAKQQCTTIEENVQLTKNNNTNFKYQSTEKKYIWRKYCKDGSAYGIDPQDYETADDYEEALLSVKSKK